MTYLRARDICKCVETDVCLLVAKHTQNIEWKKKEKKNVKSNGKQKKGPNEKKKKDKNKE